jgi:hypothetical protein
MHAAYEAILLLIAVICNYSFASQNVGIICNGPSHKRSY